MRWVFDSKGSWAADSSFMDETGGPYVWRICVCDDGDFSIHESDKGLEKHGWIFPSLAEAKAFCEKIDSGAKEQAAAAAVDTILAKRLLNPEDLGRAVSPEVCDAARELLGMARVEHARA